MAKLPIKDIKKISEIVEKQGVEEARKQMIANGYITQDEINNNIANPIKYNETFDEKMMRTLGTGFKLIGDLGVGALKGTENIADAISTAIGYGASGVQSLWDKEGAKETKDFWQDVTEKNIVDDYIAKPVDEVYGENSYIGRGNNTLDTIDSLIKGTGEILPSLALGSSMAGTVGKAGEALNIGSKATNVASKVAETLPFAIQATGGKINQALDEGATYDEATKYGIVGGINESLIEMLSGGIGGLAGNKISEKLARNPQIGTAIQRLLSNKGGKTLAKIGDTAIDLAGEGLEEVASGYIDPYLIRATYDKTRENATSDELAQQFWGGVGGSALLKGGNALINAKSILPKASDKKSVDTNNIENMTLAPIARNNTTSEYLNNLNNTVNNILPENNQLNTTIENLPTNINGKYSSNNITLNENNLSTQSYGHELNHHLSQSKGYEAYSDFVLTELDKSKKLNKIKEDIINTYQPIYEQEGRKLTESDIEQEVVSRYTESLFKDEKAVNNLLKSDKNVFKKIYNWVVDKTNYYKNVSSMTSEEKEEYDNLRKSQKLFKKALESETMPKIANDFQKNVENVAIANENVLDTFNSSKKKQNLIDLINSSKNISSDYKNNTIEAIKKINNLDENTYNSFVTQIKELDSEYKNFVESKNSNKVENTSMFEYNRTLVDDAIKLVPANNQGKRTKQEWLKVAQQIGNSVENKSQLLEYAEQSWKNLHPNIADNLNRQGQKYVKFTKEEWINAVKNNNNDKYSVQIDKNNNKYVEIDTDQDIFEGKTKKEQIKIAHDYILDKFREKGLTKDNTNIKVTGKTAGEYTHPKKSLNNEIYSSKLKASTELDNLLEISKYIKSENDDGRHIFAKNGWDYYETIFKVGNKKYSGILNIANGDNGKLLYDITNIKERASNYSVETVSVANSLTNNSITNLNQNVNTTNNNSMQEDSKYSLERGQRKHYDTIKNSNMVDEKTKNIASKLLQNDRYVPSSNKDLIDEAQKRLQKNGVKHEFDEIVNSLQEAHLKVKDLKELVARGENLLKQSENFGFSDSQIEDLSSSLAVLSTDSGQILQLYSIINKFSPQGRINLIEKCIEREKVLNKKAKDITLSEEAKNNIRNSKSQEELEENISKAVIEVAEQIPVSVNEEIRNWRYLAMLGNPRTHIRNIASNIGMKGTITIKDKIAGALEDIINPIERTKTLKRPTKEVIEFAKKDAQLMKERISNGNKYNPTNMLNQYKKNSNSKILDFIEKKSSDFLEKEDWYSSYVAYKSALSNYMTANNLTPAYLESGSKQSNVVLEKARQYAIKQAQEATFRQESDLANKLSALENKNLLSKIVVGGALPFKKTPINIAKAGFEYNITGMIKNVTYDVYQLKKGKITTAQYIDNLSKGFTGTGIACIGYILTKMGVLSASGADDEKEDKYNENLGQQDYSIKIGNSTYTIDWMSPAAIPLLTGAKIFENNENSNKDSKDKSLVSDVWGKINGVYDSILSSLDPMVEMSFLQSLTKTIRSFSSGNADSIGDMAYNAVESYIGQFVPTLLAQIARTIDDTERDTYYTGDAEGLEKSLKRTKNSIISKLPIVSKSLQPKTDIWGNEVKRNNNLLIRGFENAVAPYYRNEIKTSKVDKEIQRVYKNTGEGILPTVPNSKLTLNKQEYKLTPEDYTKYKEQYGTNAKYLLNKVISTKEYKQLEDEEKAKVINSIYDDVLNDSKESYANNKNIEYKKSNTEQKIDDLVGDGLSLVNSYIYRGEISKIEGTKNSNGKNIGGSTQGNKAKYIMNMNTSNEQKDKLLSLLNDSEKAKNVTVSDLNKIDKSSYNTFFDLSTTEDKQGNSQRDKYLMLRDLDIECSELDKYMTQIGKITGEKDDEGKTIPNSKLLKVYNLIDSLNLEPLQKVTLLIKSGYKSGTENIMLKYMTALGLDTKRQLSIMSMLYD